MSSGHRLSLMSNFVTPATPDHLMDASLLMLMDTTVKSRLTRKYSFLDTVVTGEDEVRVVVEQFIKRTMSCFYCFLESLT